MKLTVKEVEKAKAKDKAYRLSDGKGLFLYIRKNGNKSWESRYINPTTKRPTYKGLGAFPEVGLAEARKRAQEVRALVSQGIDPKLEAQEKKLAISNEQKNTFHHIAQLWAKTKSNRVKEKTLKDNWRKLELYAFPDFGKVPINQVTAPSVIASLQKLEKEGKLETIARICQLINEIMTYAVNYGLISVNPLAGVKEVFQKPTATHMLAIKPEELPELMRAIQRGNMTIITKLLVEWQLHTMTRPNEASGARWEEINLDKNEWVIPPERMKMKREHIIPLTPQTLAILEEIKPLTGHREFIFTSIRDTLKPTGSQAINKALQRIGFKDKTTAHGLRSLASTTLNEQGFNPDIIEACLAHQDKNTIRKAYNRTTYLEQRRKVLAWWSNHIEEATYTKPELTGTKSLKVI